LSAAPHQSEQSGTHRPGGDGRWWEDFLLFGFGPKLPLILQTEATECGLACVAMLANYFGRFTELTELRRNYSVSLSGVNLTHLINVSQKLNLSTRAVRAELTTIRHLRLPCILHWNFNHFVVLKKVSRTRLTILDPAIGARTVTLNEASSAFTGVALEVWPSPSFRTEAANAKNNIKISSLIGKAVGLVPLLLQTLVLAFGVELLSLTLPLMMQWIIDYVVVARDTDLLLTCALGFGLAVIVLQALTVMRGWIVMYMGATLNVQWHANVLAHLVRLPIEYFQKRHLGDIVSRFDAVEQIQNTITTSFMTAILDGVMSLATMMMMLIYSARLTSIVVIAVLLYVAVRLVTFIPLRGNTQKKIVFTAKQQTHFLETMRGIKAIKLFQKEDLRRLSWLNLFVQQINATLTTQRAALLFQTSHGLLFGLERIIVLYLGAELVINGRFTVGILVAFMTYREQFEEKVASFTDKCFEFRMLRLYASRLSDIVMSKPESDSSNVMLADETILGQEIHVKNLRFRYAAHEPLVLNDVSMTILPGEWVAIVGASGCGKTTLLSVLLGILQPTRGNITVGGIDIRYLGVNALRRLIGSVTQDDTLFAGSIAENISFFDQHLDRERIEECAKLAAVHDEIAAMPMGYRTLVGDMGTTLSGGQKQRVLIARALYKRPKILILDEATSHLDLAREASINEAIKSLKITCIIVAHRPETVAAADRAISLEGGRATIAGAGRRLDKKRNMFVGAVALDESDDYEDYSANETLEDSATDDGPSEESV
jgi:ATP-binding cassette subfamily B protein RaxB